MPKTFESEEADNLWSYSDLCRLTIGQSIYYIISKFFDRYKNNQKQNSHIDQMVLTVEAMSSIDIPTIWPPKLTINLRITDFTENDSQV